METPTNKHETVGCPRCGSAFECKVGSITLCQCVAVQLSEEQRNYVRSRFSNCLCANCLQEIRTEYNQTEHPAIPSDSEQPGGFKENLMTRTGNISGSPCASLS